jgi:hypothetical protein
MGVEKRHVAKGGKNIIFRRGGINIVFGPKYRPLLFLEAHLTELAQVAGAVLRCSEWKFLLFHVKKKLLPLRIRSQPKASQRNV